MWKKPETTDSETMDPRPSTPPAATREAARPAKSVAAIGPSISINGDVTGEEDLLVHGRLEGKVDLKQNNVTVGSGGRVEADVFGRTIVVEGEVEGNLYGSEQVVIRRSGRVRGDIVAPRVTLEDGGTFKGSIDMEAPVKDAPPRPAPVGAGRDEPPTERKPAAVSSEGEKKTA